MKRLWRRIASALAPNAALASAISRWLSAVVMTTAVASGLTAAAAPLWEPPFGLPLRISASYSLPNGPYRAGHRGIDLPAEAGDPVRIPASGTVSFVGTVVDRPVLSVRLDAHTVVSFEPITSTLREGDPIARGDVIGEVATGGHCPTACLHLGVRVDGEYVDPVRFLRPRPVLLPW